MGDCFYVPPDTFDQIEDPNALKPEMPAYLARSRFHKGGANAGLRAFGVAKLLAIQETDGQARILGTSLAAALKCAGLLMQMQQSSDSIRIALLVRLSRLWLWLGFQSGQFMTQLMRQLFASCHWLITSHCHGRR